MHKELNKDEDIAKSTQNSTIFNKFMTYYFLLVFIFSKGAMEALFTEIPVLVTHKNWYGFSYPYVGLGYFLLILVSRLKVTSHPGLLCRGPPEK